MTHQQRNEYKKIHGVYWNFIKWLYKITEVEPNNERQLFKSLAGYEIMEKVEKYAKRHKEIKISYVDDNNNSTSLMVYVSHPTHGITIIYIPQTTTISNTWFLYENHLDQIVETLTSMKGVYNGKHSNTDS